MKKIYKFLAAGVLTCLAGSIHAQERYLSEVFTDADITIHKNVVYGQNISVENTILAALQGLPPVMPDTVDLRMDIYEPSSAADTLDERPLILYLPTGNFLPPVVNGSPNGNRKDSSAVNFAKQLAKRGYVCAIVDYRKGWNPVSPNQIVRTGTILNAAYKGQQDSKTAVRFFRADRAGDNIYRIAPDKVVLLGEGTGGYVAMAHAFLDAPWKIGRLPGLGEDKFLRTQNPDSSVVDTNRVGNFDATDNIPLNIMDFALSGGDLLKVVGNVANYPDQASNVQLVINMGGALGDSSWIDPGQIPMIGIQAVRDPNAPYQIGDVIVPTTGDIVIPFASGAGNNIAKATAYGNNDSFANKIYTDPVSLAAESRYNQDIPFASSTINTGSGKGLLPFILTEATPTRFNHGSPWQFWSSTQPTAMAKLPSDTTITIHQAAAASNPFMAQGDAVGRSKALLYIDSIQQFIHPRIVCALGLEQCNLFGNVGIQNLAQRNADVQVFPNPANQGVSVRIKGSANEIIQTELFNLTGQAMRVRHTSNAQQVNIERGDLPSGIYLIRIRTSNSSYTARVIFE